MIRKIILAFAFLFVIIWLGGAHFLKSKLIDFINSSGNDNLKISYSDTSIAGFPFSWKIKFASPKITIIDQDVSRELYADNLVCVFGYSLRSASLNFGKILHYTVQGDQAPEEYLVESPQNMSIDIDFSKAFYKAEVADSIWKLFRNVSFVNESIIVLSDKSKELLDFGSVNLAISEQLAEDNTKHIQVKLGGNYKALFEGRKVDNAVVALEVNYIIAEGEAVASLGFDRKIELIKARFGFNEYYCDFKGGVNLSRTSSPKGRISAELVGYEALADILVPDDFVVSSSYMKKLIAKAAAIETGTTKVDKINLDIEFSENGINLGQVNLLDLKQ